MLIREIELSTHRLADQRDFYARQLGLPLVADTPDTVALQAGATRLTFRQGTAALYHVAFNIPRNQFEAAKSWLAQRAALLTWDNADYIHWKNWNAHAVYCYDPAGNVIELIARHNLPTDSDAPFAGTSIISVSEIGLAAPDVAGLVTHLRAQAGLPVWDAGDGENFTALGDDHGLFIVVKQGRAWFPTTDSRAELVPLHVTLAGSVEKTITIADLPYTIAIIN